MLIYKMFNRVFYFLLNIVWCTPVLNSLAAKSFIFVSAYIAVLYKNGKLEALRNVVYDVLDGQHYRSNKYKDKWWYILRFAVTCEQERRLMTFFYDLEAENKLIRLGISGPTPWEGYNVAYVYTSFSIWYFERGLIASAIDMINLATEADLTWAYPEFMLGWYGLFVNDVDPIIHFGEAVRRDWNMLSRIRNDRACQQFPSVIKKVSQAVLVK
jgi:hypothetical protein